MCEQPQYDKWDLKNRPLEELEGRVEKLKKHENEMFVELVQRNSDLRMKEMRIRELEEAITAIKEGRVTVHRRPADSRAAELANLQQVAKTILVDLCIWRRTENVKTKKRIKHLERLLAEFGYVEKPQEGEHGT